MTAALVRMDKDRFNSMFHDGIQVRCESGSSCNIHAGADSVEKSPHCNYNDTTVSLAMATATRVAGDKECDGGKSNGGKSDGDNKKGCGRATATAPKREVAAATRAAGDKEGDGEGGESDGDAYEESNGGGDEGGRRRRGQWQGR